MLVTRVSIASNYLTPVRSDLKPNNWSVSCSNRRWVSPPSRVIAMASHGMDLERRNDKRQLVCTADELHYVSVSNSDWKLALWRYLPSPKAPSRNHPLLLLSGVATNATGYDLSPESSFARNMSGQGFDTWILEVRGAGLSTFGEDSGKDKQPLEPMSEIYSALKQGINGASPTKPFPAKNHGAYSDSEINFINGKKSVKGSKFDELQLVKKFMETFTRFYERLPDFLIEALTIRGIYFPGLIEAGQKSAVASQISSLSQILKTIIEESRRTVPEQFLGLQERFIAPLEEFQKQVELIVRYDWDFDNYLEEDVPAAMEYIKTQCKPKDGKLLSIGHSMGGILLYAMLSRNCFHGKDSELASVATLGSSLDYTSSRSSLKLLLPLADPAQALNVPVIPIGALLAAAHPLANRPPYVLSWLNSLISAEDMMCPKMLEKLVLNNFCTVPSKLLLQLATAFHKGGLCDRSGSFFYKDHLHKSNVPVLALAGDQDLICPPEAVYETVKIIPQDMVTYKVFGEPGGPHYAHYDLVGGRLAADQLYPCIIEFLIQHDMD